RKNSASAAHTASSDVDESRARPGSATGARISTGRSARPGRADGAEGRAVWSIGTSGGVVGCGCTATSQVDDQDSSSFRAGHTLVDDAPPASRQQALVDRGGYSPSA